MCMCYCITCSSLVRYGCWMHYCFAAGWPSSFWANAGCLLHAGSLYFGIGKFFWVWMWPGPRLDSLSHANPPFFWQMARCHEGLINFQFVSFSSGLSFNFWITSSFVGGRCPFAWWEWCRGWGGWSCLVHACGQTTLSPTSHLPAGRQMLTRKDPSLWWRWGLELALGITSKG